MRCLRHSPPRTAAPRQPSAPLSAAKPKLNPTAKTFVPTFSLASAADAKPFVPSTVAAPAPAAAVAPAAPAPAPVSSTLKPSAKEFKPLCALQSSFCLTLSLDSD
ncbi:hypothetical protein PINS_up006443 [Pythium insidiosum]|nr:hypothetical protein PINS_up006443 [Pythium insidiosum]